MRKYFGMRRKLLNKEEDFISGAPLMESNDKEHKKSESSLHETKELLTHFKIESGDAKKVSSFTISHNIHKVLENHLKKLNISRNKWLEYNILKCVKDEE